MKMLRMSICHSGVNRHVMCRFSLSVYDITSQIAIVCTDALCLHMS